MSKPIDFTKPVQTRDGQPVTILTTTRNNPISPVVGMRDDGALMGFTAEGQFYTDGQSSDLDLINVPVKHVRKIWLNIYPGNIDIVVHETKEIADEYASTARIACIPITIEFEEGEGL